MPERDHGAPGATLTATGGEPGVGGGSRHEGEGGRTRCVGREGVGGRAGRAGRGAARRPAGRARPALGTDGTACRPPGQTSRRRTSASHRPRRPPDGSRRSGPDFQPEFRIVRAGAPMPRPAGRSRTPARVSRIRPYQRTAVRITSRGQRCPAKGRPLGSRPARPAAEALPPRGARPGGLRLRPEHAGARRAPERHDTTTATQRPTRHLRALRSSAHPLAHGRGVYQVARLRSVRRGGRLRRAGPERLRHLPVGGVGPWRTRASCSSRR